MSRLLLPYVQGMGRPQDRPSALPFRRRGFPKEGYPVCRAAPSSWPRISMAMATATAPIGIKRNAPGTVAYVVAAYLDRPSSFRPSRTGHTRNASRHP